MPVVTTRGTCHSCICISSSASMQVLSARCLSGCGHVSVQSSGNGHYIGKWDKCGCVRVDLVSSCTRQNTNLNLQGGCNFVLGICDEQ